MRGMLPASSASMYPPRTPDATVASPCCPHDSTALCSVADALMSDRNCRWLLLIHQIPPKPNYLRVKIGRRLQKLGAVAVKNSVYALPNSDEAQEQFAWVAREIAEGGGDSSICESN